MLHNVVDRLECSLDFKTILDQHKFINESKLPNALAYRFPVHTDLNIVYLREMSNYNHDPLLRDLIEFGFPIGFRADIPMCSNTVKNPSGATRFPQEAPYGGILGPIVKNP